MKKEIDRIYKCLWRAFKDIGEKQEKNKQILSVMFSSFEVNK